MTIDTRGSAIATIIPNSTGETCYYDDCGGSKRLVTVAPDDPDRERRTVCGDHLVEYLEALNT